jgi:hypothetical protein
MIMNYPNGVRLRLWTAATNGPVVHPPGDTWAWRTMVELYQQGKTPVSPTTALRKSYQQSSSSRVGRTGEGNDEFCLTKYLFHTSKGSLTCHKFLRDGADSFTFPPKEGVLQIFIALKNPSPSAGFHPRTLDSMASTLTITPPRRLSCNITIATSDDEQSPKTWFFEVQYTIVRTLRF